MNGRTFPPNLRKRGKNHHHHCWSEEHIFQLRTGNVRCNKMATIFHNGWLKRLSQSRRVFFLKFWICSCLLPTNLIFTLILWKVLLMYLFAKNIDMLLTLCQVYSWSKRALGQKCAYIPSCQRKVGQMPVHRRRLTECCTRIRARKAFDLLHKQ